MKPYREDLKNNISKQTKRWEKAKKTKTALAQLGMLGSVGLLFVIPVVLGAYLGNWLDSKLPEFSTSWTVSLIIVGVIFGAMNVYFYIRSTED
ncbi:AtpZ/AtpI family protein [Photobacterium galatheae]|uniref:AtpZ/AtpI family protein n=1 Tax=Photobacterium galatheae TaxID=1654360 RepID=UPI00202D00F9|nr:AtpZ/AtpI family protein [Photobacterium galatheae]MCM0148933.1 AtpZ/AtpI family protein [Photobacterium galatheae]